MRFSVKRFSARLRASCEGIGKKSSKPHYLWPRGHQFADAAPVFCRSRHQFKSFCEVAPPQKVKSYPAIQIQMQLGRGNANSLLDT